MLCVCVCVGSTAKVSLILSGDEDETQPRLLFDDKKSTLQRSGIDSFIMAVPRCLGTLNVLRYACTYLTTLQSVHYIELYLSYYSMLFSRIWHDNSGASPAWNFSRMQVTDLQKNDKYFFVCDRWLAVDQDDGCVSFYTDCCPSVDVDRALGS